MGTWRGGCVFVWAPARSCSCALTLTWQEGVDWSALSSSERRRVALAALSTLAERQYAFRGVPCCKACFATLHSASRSTVTSARHTIIANKAPTVELTANKRRGRPPEGREHAVLFINKWLDAHTCINARNGHVHLPFEPVHEWIFEEYVRSCSDGSCGRSTFLDALSTALGKVMTPRGKSDLKACSRCFLLSAKIMAARRAGDDSTASTFTQEWNDHLAVQHGLREQTASLCHSAVDPTHRRSLVLSLDGTHPLVFGSGGERTSLRDHLPKLYIPLFVVLDHTHARTRNWSHRGTAKETTPTPSC